MSRTIDAQWVEQLSTPKWDGNSPNKLRQAVQTALAMLFSTNLTTAGRVGFFVDYSELSDAGTHTFYVARTHGTTGEVSVRFSTGGDAHESETGIITWADGDAGIKSFTVEVTSAQLNTHQATNGLGEHRMWALLKSPTGGAELHLGSQHTRAYGVIDNDVVASDANAVFYDSAASAGGDGSSATPYNSIYDALSNIGSKRYLYGKGTTTPDATFNLSPNGGTGTLDLIVLPTGRTGESDRLYIRNWGSDTWTVTGGAATNKMGFYSDSGANYNVSNFITFKGITFDTIDSGGQSQSEGGGINYFKNSAEGVNVESCTFDNINGSSNTSGFNAYNMNGSKVWRCTSDNVSVAGDPTNGNASGLLEYYGASNLSIQRCNVSNSGVGLHFKRPEAGDVCPVVRFTVVKDCPVAIKFGFGTSGHSANYMCIQNNVFKNATSFYGIEVTGTNPDADGNNVISNNVFDNCGGGDNGAINIISAYEFKIYNNVFLNCRKMWDNRQLVSSQSNTERTIIEYADYNHDYLTSLTRYEYLANTYATSAELNAVNSSLAANDSTGDPLFTNASIEDYTLQAGSPLLSSGVGGTNKGLYSSEFITIGAN